MVSATVTIFPSFSGEGPATVCVESAVAFEMKVAVLAIKGGGSQAIKNLGFWQGL